MANKSYITYHAPKNRFEMVPLKIIDNFDSEIVGIYCKLIHISSGKSMILDWLAKKMGIGQKKLRKAIVTFEEAGYIVRKAMRDEKGHISGWNYQLFSEPVDKNKRSCAGKKIDDNEESNLTKNGQVGEKPNLTISNQVGNGNHIISNNDISYNNKDFKDKEDKESTIVDKKNKRFVKPTIEEIQTYIDEKKLHFEADRFFDYYESKGWLVGKSPMKDWKAACRTWENMRKSERKEDKKKAYDILPDDSDKCKRFKNWMRENHTEQENCLKPLSFDGYMRLQREYGKDEVCFQLDYIDANIGRFLQSDIEASIRLHFKREEQ